MMTMSLVSLRPTKFTKMAGKVCLLLLMSASVALASDVPVLMWSPERPLSDLPQPPASDKISQDTFHADYLSQVLGKQSKVLLVFLQDKLSINDISKYADVYNSNSDGGAFKNVKGLLDEHFSLELPRVMSSHLALDSLRQDFPGTVHDLGATSDPSSLDLGGEGKHLVIVRLLPVSGVENAETTIASNDEVIGKVSRHLKKRSVSYTALYTAETSEEKLSETHYHGRQLMDAPSVSSADGVFFNLTYTNGSLYAYLTSLTVCVVPGFGPDDPQPTLCNTNFTVKADHLKTANLSLTMLPNNTLSVTLNVSNIISNYTNDMFDVSFRMEIKHQLDRWEFTAGSLSVKNSSSGDMVNDANMVTRGYDSIVSLLYSFHCTSMTWYPTNTSTDMAAYITLGGFQIQPYNTPASGFSLSQDCVGWFSIGIWMALVPIAIHIVILLFGMYMIISLSTNDRFDDPKGKTLIVNAAE